MAWIAYLLALFAILISPSNSKVNDTADRVERLERQQCTMMVVLTPTGQATVCVQKM